MSNPSLDNQMEALRQQLERLRRTREQTDARMARMGDMQAEIAAVEASASSPDRAVTVVAGPGGSVKNITFSEESRKLSPAQLSSATMQALRQAVAAAARRQAGILQEQLGDNTDLLNRVLKTQEAAFAQFSETEPPAPASQPAPAGRPSAPADEDQSAPVTREEAW
ncbi:MAG TPA: YbaB/EbfC family nucleoid-associated protein [Pseudonocardiaceae bacterium]|nr:YbaB/EbfC family nucleoid-associated protein [Pseudonocardiaceae bacterium]